MHADFQATTRDLITFSTYWTPNDTTNYNGPSRPINLWHSDRLNYNGALVWSHTFTPTMINEARFNVVRWWFDEEKSNPQMLFGIPDGNITKFGSVNLADTGQVFGPPGPGIFYQTSYNIRDTLSKVYRSHSLKFGTDNYKDQVQDTATWAGLPPAYQFNNLWDWGNDAPIKESGAFDPRTGKPTGVKKYIRSSIYAFFVQDDFKVKPNLTVNLGLRWEYFGPVHEKFGSLGVVELGTGSSTLTGLTVKTGLEPAWRTQSLVQQQVRSARGLRDWVQSPAGSDHSKWPPELTGNRQLWPVAGLPAALRSVKLSKRYLRIPGQSRCAGDLWLNNGSSHVRPNDLRSRKLDGI